MLSPLCIQLRLIEREVPVLIFVTLLFGFFAASGGISRVEGCVLLALVVLYLFYVVYEARRGDPRRNVNYLKERFRRKAVVFRERLLQSY